jgi:hypothetical protein
MQTPMLDTIIAPTAQSALQWCLARWTQTDASLDTTTSVGRQTSTPPKQHFDLHISLAHVSFLNETHEWSVPFADASEADVEAMDLSDWWALKASKGNGGKDVWVINRNNFAEVLASVPAKDEYILQRCD